MENLVFLDALTIDQGDMDWSAFEELGNIVRFDTTSSEESISRLQEATIVITNKVRLAKEHFSAAPNLKLVAVLATGYDIIDLNAAREHDVMVCNVPSYSTESVAQTTFALLLELLMEVGNYNKEIHDGAWTDSPHFSYWKPSLTELSGKTHVVVGYGTIGKRVAEISKAFGMEVLLTSLRGTHHDAPFPSLPLDEALSKADVVSLHCPLTEENKEVVNADWLKKMKPSAYFINVARGGLIQEEDLADALLDNRLAGFGADVLSSEPPSKDHPLLQTPRTVLTSHLAWATQESRQRLWSTCFENIRCFLQENPQNQVG